jgi:trehalose 6-phosphate phosphatase
MAAALADLAPRFELLSGDRVLEIKPTGCTKATAVQAFLDERPFHGRMPVYLGDDVTDLDGFDAVRQHHGVDIAVGRRVSARWSLAAPAAVREWLMSLLGPNGDPG